MLFCRRFKKSFLFVVSLAVLFCVTDVHAGKKKPGRSNHIERCYQKGLAAFEQADYPAAYMSFFIAANKGHAGAQYELGGCYFRGTGVKRDAAEALEWFGKAAEQGHGRAQYALGCYYQTGTGVEKDVAEATKWFKEVVKQEGKYVEAIMVTVLQDVIDYHEKPTAVHQDLLDKLYRSGKDYCFGRSCEKNILQAFCYFEVSGDLGHAKSQYQLAALYHRGEGELAQDYEKAAKWYKAAASQNHMLACYYLGKLYDQGKGVDLDEEKAASLYNKVIELGNQSDSLTKDEKDVYEKAQTIMSNRCAA